MAFVGHVRPAHDYHAFAHGVRWPSVLLALANCDRVVKDRRHRDGHIAWGHHRPDGRLRVDFNLEERPEGGWAVVVTAFEVES